MNREREKIIASVFRQYKTNKKELAQDYNIPVPSGVDYGKIKVKGDISKNVQLDMTVEYISKREELFKKVFIVEETLRWFELEGHGRERFIRSLLIDSSSWVKTELDCHIAHATIVRWRIEALEKAEMIAKWINFF